MKNQIFYCLTTTQNSQIMGINLKIGKKEISVFNKSMNVNIKDLIISESVFFLNNCTKNSIFVENLIFQMIQRKLQNEYFCKFFFSIIYFKSYSFISFVELTLF